MVQPCGSELLPAIIGRSVGAPGKNPPGFGGGVSATWGGLLASVGKGSGFAWGVIARVYGAHKSAVENTQLVKGEFGWAGWCLTRRGWRSFAALRNHIKRRYFKASGLFDPGGQWPARGPWTSGGSGFSGIGHFDNPVGKPCSSGLWGICHFRQGGEHSGEAPDRTGSFCLGRIPRRGMRFRKSRRWGFKRPACGGNRGSFFH